MVLPKLPESTEWQANPEAYHRDLVNWLLQLDQNQLQELCQQILPQLTSEEFQRNLLTNLTGAVDMSLNQGDIRGAARVLEVVETIAEDLNSAWAIAECYYWRGRLAMEKGQPKDAVPHFEKAAVGTEDPEKKVIALHSLALALFHSGNLAEARQRFQEAIKFSQEHSNALGLAQSYLGLAQVARAKNEESKARHWLEKALTEAQRVGATDVIIQIRGELGLVHAQENILSASREEYKQFEDYLTEELSQITGAMQIRALSALMANKAALAIREGRIEEGRQYAEEALAKQSSLPKVEQIENLVVAGTINILSGNLDIGKQRLLSAFRLAEVYYPGMKLVSGLSLSSAYTLQGYYEPAYRVCAIAINALEGLRSRVGDETTRIQYVRDFIRIYDLVVILCLALADLQQTPRYHYQALAYVERAKSRTFIEALGRTTNLALKSDLPPDLLRKEADLLAKLKELETYLQTSLNMKEQEETQSAYDEVLTELDAVWEQITKMAPEYAALRRGQPIAFDEIRILLDSQSTALDSGELRSPLKQLEESEKGQVVLGKESESVQAYVLFNNGTTLAKSVGTDQNAASYEQIIEQITIAGDMVQVEEVVLRNMAVFDQAWWDYLNQLISELSELGQQEFAQQEIDVGKFVCDRILIYGTMEQLLMASCWWNQYLVADIVEQMHNLKGEEETEKTISNVLQAATHQEIYTLLLEILSQLKPNSCYIYLQNLIVANLNWLDKNFFNGLSCAIQEQERQGKKEVAWRCFVAGVIASAKLFHFGSITQLDSAMSFTDQFPELRFP